MINQKLNIHLFSPKPDLNLLIKKFLEGNKYNISCTNTEEINENILSLNSTNKFDCIIIDKSIEKNLKDKIKKNFKGTPMICLPSLIEDNNTEVDIRYIDEPFRLSELGKMLNEIFP
jgi:hypothetical protein